MLFRATYKMSMELSVCHTIQYNTIQYNTIPYNTIHSIVAVQKADLQNKANNKGEESAHENQPDEVHRRRD